MAKHGPNLIDLRLAKAIEHPIRAEILSILREGPSSPARIQRQLDDVSLNLVSHHVKVLKEVGCIELVETVSKRGAKEHIYRATGEIFIDAEEWDELSPKMRQPITARVLRSVSNDLARSLGAGVFDEIADNHLSRTPLRLDQEGWSEVTDSLERILREIIAIKERSAERIEGGQEAEIEAIVALMQFPMPKSKGLGPTGPAGPPGE